MALEALQMTAVLPADPHRVYEAWLDPSEHAAFTGFAATIDPVIGGVFRGGDGYFEGQLLWLDPGRRIVQTFRTAEFPPDAKPSLVELQLEACEEGTRFTLLHTSIPAGQRSTYEDGWRAHYLEPLVAWFEGKGRRLDAAGEGAASGA